MGPHVEGAIIGLYTYARALKDAHVAKCGAGTRGLCRELAEMTQEEFLNNYLKAVDFTFTKDERIPTLASSQVTITVKILQAHNNILGKVESFLVNLFLLQIEPFLSAKRVRYTDTGDPVDPMFIVYNYNRLSGNFKFDRVSTLITSQ